MPGRVVWVYDPDCVEWDGQGWWWELSHFDETAIQTMVDNSITSLGGEVPARASWDALFQAHNQSRGKTGGYAAGEKSPLRPTSTAPPSWTTIKSFEDVVQILWVDAAARILYNDCGQAGGLLPSNQNTIPLGRKYPAFFREPGFQTAMGVLYWLEIHKKRDPNDRREEDSTV